ncbi:MAG: hypothetical protein JJ866_15070 [Roseibium sp.]|uniref:hypothetical protein n=1 Tax=Roseibium sp. TaxID=1936156 RepID=UPI001B1F3C01|nr:hypothetical protein [Roseibium sp.]MBO6893263.1 hypothetical protein [Roseibium sp.]MBO6930627.1 hypothetical protein [Roseibium sp.]
MCEHKWEWVPGLRVGPVAFGSEIDGYRTTLNLRLLEPEGADETGWGTYSFDNEDKTIWTENGKVICVRCDDYFGFKGVNLIGLAREELIAQMGAKPDEIGLSVEFEDGSILTPFEYFDLSLEIWIEEGAVVHASATAIFME